MFSSISKNAALVTGSLIFLGYCKYHFYYSTFGIDIYPYISTPELLLSFLPVIVYFFIPLSLLIYIAILAPPAKYRNAKGEDITSIIEKRTVRRRPLRLLNHLLFTKRISLKLRSKLTVRLLIDRLFIAFMLLIYFSVRFFVHFDELKTYQELEGVFLALSFCWLVFIIAPFLSKLASQRNWTFFGNDALFGVALINYFFILTYFIFWTEKFSAFKTLHNEETRKVILTLKSGETLKTDSTLVYIGQTNQYFFLRNKKDSSNIILNTSLVDKTIVSEIQNTKLKHK